MSNSLYKATFILNLRGAKRSVDQIITWLKEVITATGAQVQSVNDLGVRNFAYVTQTQNPTGHYVEIAFSYDKGGDVNTLIQSKFTLESEIKRVYIQGVEAPVAK